MGPDTHTQHHQCVNEYGNQHVAETGVDEPDQDRPGIYKLYDINRLELPGRSTGFVVGNNIENVGDKKLHQAGDKPVAGDQKYITRPGKYQGC